ncbi:MAG: tetratricopeptide repeat protein, partial [Deltaproteobacteria bacterium]|nr:tetratricopeptide repeat protein [Deltaproteobacteria bacterium]
MQTSTALVGLGECLFEIGRYNEAASVFEAALKTWSLSHRPYLGLGRIHLAQDRLDEAEKYFARLGGMDGKENPEVHRAMGLLCERRGQPELALNCYLTAFKYDPADEKTLDLIYETGAGIGKWDKIRGALKKFLEVNPGHDQARKKFADIEHRLTKNSTPDRQKKTNPRPQSGLANAVGQPGQNTSGPKTSRKIGRNSPCPCGSGKKYKKCCLNKADARAQSAHPNNQGSRQSVAASKPELVSGAKDGPDSVSGRLGIRIISPADFDADVNRRPLWGDYWVKEELTREFSRLGCVAEEQDPDVILYLFGTPIEGLPKHTYNIVWVYSHPDMVTPENLRQFDKIFSLAPEYTEKLVKMGYSNVETMIGATSKTPLKRRIKYDIVF